ncbi:MAG: tRNA lysidine(34) synthetase TilS [Bdellovibrionales bacterium GWA2_49_15]|nr:MAG: tRNA lysidine(34) synthetase TilS [Bdellovibrionales bacterium GWA2_49_15]HAZ14873.1 tRNA lysidine(34) synthetase TilS [Bdellovibrionales bacterium]
MFVKQTNNLEALAEWPFSYQKNGPFFLMKMATYLLQFMQKHQLLGPAQAVNYFIGVSGGADSMALLSLLWAIRRLNPEIFQSLTVIHINHGTRKACGEEQDFVEQVARQLGVGFKAHQLSLDLKEGNFEMRARHERYRIFRSYVNDSGNNHWFYLAHQLDDSFEWSLLQSLKSSNPASTLGIPLVNGAFARPLLCLSRQQLLKLIRAIGLPYKHDVSNLDPKFERGYLRQRIIPSIQARYPQYLANYVSRANQWAHYFKLHRLEHPRHDFQLIDDGLGGKLLLLHGVNKNIERIEEVLRREIEQLSTQGRGRLRNQLARLFQAYGNQKIGPLHFSGGVLAYLLPGMIHLVSKQKLPAYQAMDRSLAPLLSKGALFMTARPSHLPETSVYILPIPIRVKLGKNGPRGHFGVHPLLEQSCSVLREKIWKMRKANKNDQELAPGLSTLSFLLTEGAQDVLHSQLPTLSTMTILELSPVEF